MYLVEDLETVFEQKEFHEDCLFKSMDFSSHSMDDYNFEGCHFKGCRFQDMKMTGTTFKNCLFQECQLLLVKMYDVVLNEVEFRDCKLMGLNFSDCNTFSFEPEFRDSHMSHMIFSNMIFRKAVLTSCRLEESDFTDCDLRESNFTKTEFRQVMFHHCKLDKADFREASGYSINPESNSIRNARFNLPEAESFLGFLNILIE